MNILNYDTASEASAFFAEKAPSAWNSAFLFLSFLYDISGFSPLPGPVLLFQHNFVFPAAAAERHGGYILRNRNRIIVLRSD